ncbi:hypothetical protein U9M48_015489 [Paspalum notatum var. saurae]|uniref:Uncharacterized protein n=1 Tax=Paspalum notatum var. saurae TaxID=547442 RepID=A0AAQ3WLL5_PASNO
MALRSLVFKMKDLSRPVPDARAFATTSNRVRNPRRASWTNTAATTGDASRHPRAVNKFSRIMESVVEQEFKPPERRIVWIVRGTVVMLVSCAASSYILSSN